MKTKLKLMYCCYFWISIFQVLREVDGQVDVRFFGAHDRYAILK